MDLVGKGGMGCIYKVHDNTLNEQVALKTLLPQFVSDKLVVERFFNEARIARQLSHPNIVRVHDIGIADSTVYISMELLEGKSLRGVLDHQPAGQRMPVTETLRIVIQLCKALEYAHQYTIHRDIKPENVMMVKSGGIKLMDFGISKLMTNNQLTATSVVMGTPHYMSPEQLKDSRNVDVRADIYSVGVMLYEMLTGNLPTGVPKPASQIMQSVPASLDVVIAKCVEPDPNERYSNALELREVLEAVLQTLESEGSEIKIPVPTPGRKAIAQGQSSRTLGIVLCVVIAVIAAAGIGMAEKRRRTLMQESTVRQESYIRASSEPFLEFPSFVAFESAMNRARGKAERQARTDSAHQQLFDDSAAAFEIAKESYGSNPDESARSGRKALQGFMALCLWRTGMTYVPGGPMDTGTQQVEVPPFLIDTQPVTIQKYMDFMRNVPDGWPNGLRGQDTTDPSRPVTMVTFYDAQAYAAYNGLFVPTATQWARALDHFKLSSIQSVTGTVGNLKEWSRSVVGHELDAVYVPSFDDSLHIFDITVTSDGETSTLSWRNETANFSVASPILGFRCVQELPTAPREVERIISM
ncbi:MAG: hypothetical protein AMXMBFR84_36370 [Candidatus Hydrogenedentota bacterium]